jgi:ferredoxin
VLYDGDICVGCRYCQIACPYSVPKFEWDKAFPRIVKCELCRGRADASASGPLSVARPACAQVCPADAVVYGKRSALLAEAKRRIAGDPGQYNPEIYGEHENGGCQVLYLAAANVSFQQLGLPDLHDQSSAQFSESVSHAPYLHGVTPIVLYGIAAFVVRRNKKLQDGAGKEKDQP